jgi:small subunit ribosomal protein S6
MTQNYELLYIIPNRYSEMEIKSITEKIDKWLVQKGCQVLKNENLGEKRLAYPIKQVRNGHYILREFAAEKEIIHEINQFLILTEGVLRHLIIKIEPVKIAKVKKIRAKRVVKEIPPQKEEKPTQEERPEKKTKISLENLDQKLDEILQEKII